MPEHLTPWQFLGWVLAVTFTLVIVLGFVVAALSIAEMFRERRRRDERNHMAAMAALDLVNVGKVVRGAEAEPIIPGDLMRRLAPDDPAKRGDAP